MKKVLDKIAITGGKGLLGSQFKKKYGKVYKIISYPHRLENFEKVIIHGFDFFIDSKSHYNESFIIKWLIDLGINKKGGKHNMMAEKQFIEKLINKNQVILLKDYLQQ